MPTFKFNSERPYYQRWTAGEKSEDAAKRQSQCHGLHHLGVDCGAFVGQAHSGSDFQTQSVPTALALRRTR